MSKQSVNGIWVRTKWSSKNNTENKYAHFGIEFAFVLSQKIILFLPICSSKLSKTKSGRRASADLEADFCHLGVTPQVTLLGVRIPILFLIRFLVIFVFVGHGSDPWFWSKELKNKINVCRSPLVADNEAGWSRGQLPTQAGKRVKAMCRPGPPDGRAVRVERSTGCPAWSRSGLDCGSFSRSFWTSPSPGALPHFQ